MLAGIFGFFTALPELIKLGGELFVWLKAMFGDDPKKFIKDAGEAFERLNQAKTAEERSQAATDISVLIKRL